MTTTADKLIQFAKSNKIKKDEWMEAIEHLYTGQVDMQLEQSGNDVFEHDIVMDRSMVTITSVREVIN